MQCIYIVQRDSLFIHVLLREFYVFVLCCVYVAGNRVVSFLGVIIYFLLFSVLHVSVCIMDNTCFI